MCWGCWRLSSQSTGQTSPGAPCLERCLQAGGRAAADVAGTGFSPVPSGTVGAAADACSGKRDTSREWQAGKKRLPVAEEGGALCVTPQGGTGPVGRQPDGEDSIPKFWDFYESLGFVARVKPNRKNVTRGPRVWWVWGRPGLAVY